jgi:hypothetical protein
LFKAKQTAINAAVSGMIKQNPNVDLDAIQKKYGEYLEPGALKTFQAAAQRQAKTDAAAARADQIVQKQQADLKVHQESTKVMTDNLRINQRPNNDPKFFDRWRSRGIPTRRPSGTRHLDWGGAAEPRRRDRHRSGHATELTDRMFDPEATDGMI